MDRRTFLAGTGAVLLAAPLAVEAQQAGKVYRIGVLANEPSPMWEAFRQRLKELGYVERNAVAQHTTSAERSSGKGEEAREHLITATTMYREMDMRIWLEQAEADWDT